MDAPSPESDSSHVGAVYRSALLTPTALRWYGVFAIAWLVNSVFYAPGMLFINPGNPDLFGIGLDFTVFDFLMPLLVLLPLGGLALSRWRLAIRAFDRDLPAESEWRETVLARVRRGARVAAVGAAVCGVSPIAFLIGIATTSSGAGGPPANATPFLDTLAVTLVAVAVAVLMTVHWVAVRAVSAPIAGSYVREIDSELASARRLYVRTAPAAFVPVVVLGVSFGFGAEGASVLWPLAWFGVIAPLGLWGAVRHLRRAYDRWLDLAQRLVGRATIDLAVGF